MHAYDTPIISFLQQIVFKFLSCCFYSVTQFCFFLMIPVEFFVHLE